MRGIELTERDLNEPIWIKVVPTVYSLTDGEFTMRPITTRKRNWRNDPEKSFNVTNRVKFVKDKPANPEVVLDDKLLRIIKKAEDEKCTTILQMLTVANREAQYLSWLEETTLVDAWRYGYKKPTFFVQNEEGLSLLVRENDEIKSCLGVSKKQQEQELDKYTFTKQEIEWYDRRYWAFAVPSDALRD